MAIPDFQTLMLPVLKQLSQVEESSTRNLADLLATEFKLTDSERKELLTSKQPRFDNRVHWAVGHLKRAGLIERTSKAHYRVTQRGYLVLKENPAIINVKFLKQFPEFLEYQRGSFVEVKEEPSSQIPGETLETSYQKLRRELAQEILELVHNCSPRFFEQLVVDLLVSMGYGGSRKDAGQAVGQSGDGGIDGIIKEDKLGLDVVYIQAKRWTGTVGRPVVQAFAGSLDGFRARKGVLITTSQFTRDAHDYVSRIEKKIVLIDGEQLAQLMIDHDIGVTEIARYVVKKIDTDYFDEAL
jgi:restriction system protein